MDRLPMNEIREEYKRIDNNWLHLHYKLSIGLVLFSILVECFMGFIMLNSDLLTTTVFKFIVKFIIIPGTINLICLVIDAYFMHSKKFSVKTKTYAISFILVIISFILFTAHNAFTAIYFILVLPIILTTIYADYRLTSMIAIACLISFIASEFFIQWDVDKESVFDNTLRMGDILICFFLLFVFSAICMVTIGYERKKNEVSIYKELQHQRLQKKLQLDELTGVFNRKALRNAFRTMEADPCPNDYTFAMIDIDNFKGINDIYGHPIGDQCLAAFGKILKENCNKATPFRYGGDEFCLLFHQADMKEVQQTCEQIQNRLRTLTFPEHNDITMTSSFGIATYSEQLSSTKLLVHTDKALYRAKRLKDTIQIYQPSDITEYNL